MVRTLIRPRQNILITGFGPFPGVPRNVSGEIAEQLQAAAAPLHPGSTVTSLVLATEWSQGLSMLRQALLDLEPAIALHFGVSHVATGFQIEMLARCTANPMADDVGCLPRHEDVFDNPTGDLVSSFPAEAIARRLTEHGLPASLSQDAGRYLCNAALYTSLADQEGCRGHTLRGFIHIPTELTPETITPADAVRGGLAALDVCIASLRTAE